MTKLDTTNTNGLFLNTSESNEPENIDFDYVEKVFTESFDEMIARESSESIKQITSRALNIYYNYNEFSMLSKAGIEKLSILTFENAEFRNLILNLTVHVKILLFKDTNYLNSLVDVISLSVDNVNYNNSILSDAIKLSIRIDPEEVKNSIKNDYWLLTLLLLKLYLRKTIFFQTIQNE